MLDLEELKKELRGFGPADHDYPVIVRALAAIEQLQERLERAEVAGRKAMQDEIIGSLAHYEAHKCAQIAASVIADPSEVKRMQEYFAANPDAKLYPQKPDPGPWNKQASSDDTSA